MFVTSIGFAESKHLVGSIDSLIALVICPHSHSHDTNMGHLGKRSKARHRATGLLCICVVCAMYLCSTFHELSRKYVFGRLSNFSLWSALQVKPMQLPILVPSCLITARSSVHFEEWALVTGFEAGMNHYLLHLLYWLNHIQVFCC